MKDFFKNNAGLIIVIVAIIAVIWYVFLRKKKAESSFRSGGVANTSKMCCTEALVNGYCYGSWVNCSRVTN